MGLYLDSGYINIRHCLRSGCPFVIIVGGRGTGKTYGALQAAIEDQTPFILLRRTQAQADLIGKTEFSPIQPVVNDMGRTQSCKPLSKYTSAIYLDPDSEQPQLIGWTAALSTFSNLRGFDASSVQLIIYDEFIPESHERPIKNEGDAFLNCYETINRNRELQGRPPVQALLLSNANRMDSPILEALGLISVLERMNKTGQETYINREAGVALYVIRRSPISSRKTDTALYRATKSDRFERMSLGNEFAYDDLADIKPQPLQGWRLLLRLGAVYIYEQGGRWYVSHHCAGKPGREYEDTEIDLQRFIRDYPYTWQRIIRHGVLYEDYAAKAALTKLFV